ncbi:MAG TPA: DUF222 domain-containing protein [Beutenbergiaceae bacterium]|nr:DUF222 domain-containing protein [Beutenbergiaceae bacterium]
MSTTQQPVAPSLTADLEALEQIVARIAEADIATEQLSHSGPLLGEAAVRIHQSTQRLIGKRLQWLAAEEADGRWALGGARTYATHVAHTHHIPQSAAKADVRLARQLREEIREFGLALRHGRVGADQVRILARGALTSQARIAALQEQAQAEDAATTDADTEEAGATVEDSGGSDAGADAMNHDTEHHATVEQLLLRQAQKMRPEEFRMLVRHFATVADPEADDRGYRKAQEREHFDVSRTLDGYHVRGFLTEEHGQQVCTALDAVMGPPARDETRSSTQRRAQGLADMARLVLDQGLAGTSASVRPHVGVLIGPEQFHEMMQAAAQSSTDHAGDGGTDHRGDANRRNGADAAHRRREDRNVATRKAELNPFDHPAFVRWDWDAILGNPPPRWTDGTGPVPAQVLRRLARCSDVYRVLFSPEGEVLNHGRAHRLFTAAQRRAIVARDRHCTYPGCTAPPILCETHHAIVRWADDGRTDVDNGALLCFHHHDLVETRGIAMAREAGRWRFYRRDGTELPSDYPQPWPTAADVGRNPRPGRRTPWKHRE